MRNSTVKMKPTKGLTDPSSIGKSCFRITHEGDFESDPAMQELLDFIAEAGFDDDSSFNSDATLSTNVLMLESADSGLVGLRSNKR